eukprot:gnl/TRDRNA2_/TRDRNA2_158730_c0_seq1.p1 gnl/TRDRNA2_/TRDRNA2_158730_c0~~gnl/TRDRNA2_/TRDRNA2_158730_c0_seq1.p1  ORF type:complete len:395 (-),score=73.20 gnl/TRDRNA2_/TRDRNA2_158730_c0_seq1:158-1294(-)
MDGGGSEDARSKKEAGTEEEKDKRSTLHRYTHEVQVGELVKVQTNLGWESVTVRAKRKNGKIDIEFKDGEYMRSVLPRILREPGKDVSKVPEAGAVSAPTTLNSSDETEGAAGSSGGYAVAAASLSSTTPFAPQAPAPPPGRPARSAMGTNSSSSSAGNFRGSSSLPLPHHVGSSSCLPHGGAGEKDATFDLAKVAMTEYLRGLCNPSSSAGATGTAASSTGSNLGLDRPLGNERPPTDADCGVKAPPPPSEAPGPSSSSAVPTPTGAEPQFRSSFRSASLQSPAAASGAAGRGARGLSVSSFGAPPTSNPDESRLHEARLRQHLQQLINVRPIITHRKPSASGPDCSMPRSARHTTRRPQEPGGPWAVSRRHTLGFR